GSRTRPLHYSAPRRSCPASRTSRRLSGRCSPGERMTLNRRRVVRVPASSANLGPGYDSLAAALALQMELEAEETGSFSIETDMPGLPLDRDNLCVRGFEALRPADGIAFRIR